MSVQGEDSVGPDVSASAAAPRDGSIDFTLYSLQQLNDLHDTLDRGKFPLNFANLSAELARRAADGAEQRQQFAGRFTPSVGLRGWLEARPKRLVVYGSGFIEVTPTQVVLLGCQRNWLGAELPVRIALPRDSIRNAVRRDRLVYFQSRTRSGLRVGFVEFLADAPEQAEGLMAALPSARTSKFDQRRWEDIRDFNDRVTAISKTPWVTPALVGANIAVFLAMLGMNAQIGLFTIDQLARWGGNFAPLTTQGQWWRLITALFIHVNLGHLLVNMWALWNVGRITERLYGRRTFLFVYFAAGIFASLASLLWNPLRLSVGASGAIFGIFGAFLAFLLVRRSEVPASILRAYRLSTSVFVVVNLVAGLLNGNVDNAAHVGGLVGGFLFGLILARPLNAAAREEPPIARAGGATALLVIAAAFAWWHVGNLSARMTVPEAYLYKRNWYLVGESDSLRRWQTLTAQLGAGTLSSAEFARRARAEVLPFWQSADQRLVSEAASLQPSERAFASLLLSFVHAEEELTQTVVGAAEGSQLETLDISGPKGQLDAAQARLSRAVLLANVQKQQHSLSNLEPMQDIARQFQSLLIALRLRAEPEFTCISAPLTGPYPLSLASASDGPALRRKAGCEAQRLFLAGDYRALDRIMNDDAKSLGDLPDGSSRLEGISHGLADLFERGRFDVMQQLARIIEWRRAVPGSAQPNIVEAMIFQEWAWQARGHGFANEVTQQAFATFAQRVEMAAASLEETAGWAQGSPIWYELSLMSGIDRSIGKDKLHAILNEGAQKYPRYLPLYRAMLRALMPRWGGSYDEVDKFIREQAARKFEDHEFSTYARLYWIYGSLEGEGVSIFSDAHAEWINMQTGFVELRHDFPHSDLVLNEYAKYACMSHDAGAFELLRPQLKDHIAPTAWNERLSVEACGTQFAAQAKSAHASERSGSAAAPGATIDARVAQLDAEADVAKDRKDWVTMKAKAESLSAYYPASPRVHYYLAVAAMNTRDYPTARTELHKMLDTDSKSSSAWFSLGEIDIAEKDWSAANADFTRAIELDPKMWSAYSERSVVRDALNQRPAALEDARLACRNGFAFACRVVEELSPPK